MCLLWGFQFLENVAVCRPAAKPSLRHVAVHLRRLQDWNKQIVSLSLASFNRPTTQEEETLSPRAETLLSYNCLHPKCSSLVPVIHAWFRMVATPSCVALFWTVCFPPTLALTQAKPSLVNPCPEVKEVKQSSSVQIRATATEGVRQGIAEGCGEVLSTTARGPFGQEDRLSGWT